MRILEKEIKQKTKQRKKIPTILSLLKQVRLVDGVNQIKNTISTYHLGGLIII